MLGLNIGGEEYSPSAVSRLAWQLWKQNIPVSVDEFFLKCKQFTEAEDLLYKASVYPRPLDDGVTLQHCRHTHFPEWAEGIEQEVYEWWIVAEDMMIPVLDPFDLMDKIAEKAWLKK